MLITPHASLKPSIQGQVYNSAPGVDMVVAPLVAVLHPENDVGWSFQMNPAEPGMAWAEHSLEGIKTASTAGFAWHRANIKLSANNPITFTSHIVGHAACWRPALEFNVLQYPRHWSSIATPDKMAAVDGLGTYGSYVADANSFMTVVGNHYPAGSSCHIFSSLLEYTLIACSPLEGERPWLYQNPSGWQSPPTSA